MHVQQCPYALPNDGVIIDNENGVLPHIDIGGKMQNIVIFDTIRRKLSPHYTELPVQLDLFRGGSGEFP